MQFPRFWCCGLPQQDCGPWEKSFTGFNQKRINQNFTVEKHDATAKTITRSSKMRRPFPFGKRYIHRTEKNGPKHHVRGLPIKTWSMQATLHPAVQNLTGFCFLVEKKSKSFFYVFLVQFLLSLSTLSLKYNPN